MYLTQAEKQRNQEAKLVRLKAQVVNRIKENEELEAQLRTIEKKTSHLINNRKTVEDLPELKKKLKNQVQQFVMEDARRQKEVNDFLEKCEKLVGYSR